MREKIIWGMAGALIILVLVGIFWLGRWQGTRSCPLVPRDLGERKVSVQDSGAVSIEQAVPEKKSVEDKTTGAGESQGQTAATKETAGWKTFENKPQGYKISYPPSGQIAQAWTSGHEADVDPTDGACVNLKLEGGYVTIVGKTRTDEQMAMCLGTGLGTEWGPAGKIEVEVFGKKYTLSGMKTESASAGYKKEFYVVNADSGERVKLGIEVNEKYAPELTFEEAKAEILAVLKTMEHI
jgi:hypothetical protein